MLRLLFWYVLRGAAQFGSALENSISALTDLNIILHGEWAMKNKNNHYSKQLNLSYIQWSSKRMAEWVIIYLHNVWNRIINGAGWWFPAISFDTILRVGGGGIYEASGLYKDLFIQSVLSIPRKRWLRVRLCCAISPWHNLLYIPHKFTQQSPR